MINLLKILVVNILCIVTLYAQNVQIGAFVAEEVGVDHISFDGHEFDDAIERSMSIGAGAFVRLPLVWGLNFYGMASYPIMRTDYYEVSNPNGLDGLFDYSLEIEDGKDSPDWFFTDYYMPDYALADIKNTFVGAYLTKVIISTMPKAEWGDWVFSYEAGFGCYYRIRRLNIDYSTAYDIYEWDRYNSAGNSIYYYRDTELDYGQDGDAIYILRSLSFPFVNKINIDWKRLNLNVDFNFLFGEDFVTVFSFGTAVNIGHVPDKFWPKYQY